MFVLLVTFLHFKVLLLQLCCHSLLVLYTVNRYTYSCPPPSMRDAGEVCLRHVMLHSVNHGREAEDAHGDEEEEAAHLLVTLTQSEAKRSQACGVSGQLQDPKDSHQSHDPQHLAELPHLPHRLNVGFVLHVVLLVVEELQDGLHVLRQDGDQVHGVEHAPAEGFELRRGHQAEEVLHGEEGDAHGLHVFPVCLTTELTCGSSVLHLLHRVESHGHQGDQDKHTGGHRHQLGLDGRKRFLHQVPDRSALLAHEHVMEELFVLLNLHLRLQLPLDLQLLIQLVLPLLEGDATAAVGVLDPHAPVVDLLQEVAGTQLVLDPEHSRPVEVEDTVEDVWVPVEEVLVVDDSVVIAQVQLHVVVRVGGQSSYSGLWILCSRFIGNLIGLPSDIDVDHVVLLGQ